MPVSLTRRNRHSFKQKGGRYASTRKNHQYYPPGPCQCRPKIGNTRPAYGCLPPHELSKVFPVVVKEDSVLRGGTRKELSPKQKREAIAKILGVNADDEASFIDALPLSAVEKLRLKKEYLRPLRPTTWDEDPDMWLDSNNIRDVMVQYEDDRNDFEFMGPFPIDFAAPDPYKDGPKDKCLIGEICNIDLATLRSKGRDKVGIIYNLDPHYKNGSHWVANYIDTKKHRCYYFDSYGMEAPPQIEKFMQFLTLQDPSMKLAYNARRFQFKGSECGMYSMYFIIRMLMGEDFRHFCRRAPRDGAMLFLRNWMFSK